MLSIFLLSPAEVTSSGYPSSFNSFLILYSYALPLFLAYFPPLLLVFAFSSSHLIHPLLTKCDFAFWVTSPCIGQINVNGSSNPLYSEEE